LGGGQFPWEKGGYVTVTWLGLVAGTLTSIAVVPQLVRTFRTRHARDLSIWQPLLLMTGMVLWLLYGICIRDLPLVAANGFSLVCYLLLVIMKIVFDREDCRRGICNSAAVYAAAKEEK
jgi:MtN3 and saliva related transmembrane protein